VQEVFVALLQTLPSFDYDRNRNFRAWLRALLVNKLRDRIRRRERLTRAQPHLVLDIELPDFAERFWETEYQRELCSQALRLIQAEFEAATWTACWETIVSGRPADEVARQLGMSRNAVYIAKCRVLRRLRQELDGLAD
jgi:RNA polymerase sigma-70 factor (ECF subfamily)